MNGDVEISAPETLRPDHDLFPVRAKYDDKSYTIGLNYLTSSEPLWYTLADCIGSKLLTGKMPAIDQALTFEPGPPQQGLQPIDRDGLASRSNRRADSEKNEQSQNQWFRNCMFHGCISKLRRR